jgi:16S rRNA (guanine(966)-N(2))-methyltransferase RsmD
VRIVGGKHSGRKIEVSKSFDSRPTTDFAREALFNIMANHFDFNEIAVLDLFTGTGSISFEFASRGCADIDLVDINVRSIQFISRIAGEIGLKGLHPVKMDVFRFIPICRKQYDIVFADPPYDLKNLEELPGLVFGKQLLLSGGWFVLEHGKSHNFKDSPHFREERKYGSVHFSIFQ